MRPLALVAGVALLTRSLAAQEVPASCLRVGFGAWQPPLNWTGAGHRDSAARLGARDRQLRDSVYDGAATASGREEMRWFDGGTRLIVFPPWWPVGITVTFDRPGTSLARGDTLTGDAVALVADASQRPPRTRARVLRAC
jgi:hypothetical protein